MIFDTIFVAGLVVAILGIPALVGSFVDQRWPFLALFLFFSGGGGIAYAMLKNPGLYTPAYVMDAIFGVIARIIT